MEIKLFLNRLKFFLKNLKFELSKIKSSLMNINNIELLDAKLQLSIENEKKKIYNFNDIFLF